MSYLKVHTSQNVLLEIPVGNLGQRLLAALLDLIVIILYVIGSSYLFTSIINLSNNSGLYAFFFVVLLPALLYLPVSEYIWKGKTVGKKILKLKVIRADGSTPSLGDITLRWLLRIIDVKLGFLFIFFLPNNPSSGVQDTFINLVIFFLIIPFPLVGIISMASTPLCQRLGDIVANTAVVINRRSVSLDDTILLAGDDLDYEPRFKNVLKLSDQDIYIIKKALDEVEKTHDYHNIGVLGEKARKVLDIEDEIKPLQLLQTIVRDYTYLAKKKDLVE